MRRNRRTMVATSTIGSWMSRVYRLEAENEKLRTDLLFAKAKIKAIRVRIEMVDDGESCYQSHDAVPDILNILRGGTLWTGSPQYAAVKKRL